MPDLVTIQRKPSWWIAAAILLFSLAVMPFAVAAPPEGVPSGPPESTPAGAPESTPAGAPEGAGQQLREEMAAEGQRISAEQQAFAEQAEIWAQEFAELVQDWTDCIKEAASSNETNQESGEVVHPLEACGELDVEQSPGHRISSEPLIE